MSDEGKIFAITGFGGGVSVGIKADSYTEFLNLAKDVYGDSVGELFAVGVFEHLRRFAPEATAVASVEQSVGGVQVVTPPVSTVGAALPQPPAAPQGNVAPLAPPSVPYPGDCEHGRRVYRDTKARGRDWRRWECAIPWSKDVQGRCAHINVSQ